MPITTHDAVTLETIGDLPEEYRDTVVHQMLANGEGELSAGDTYVGSFYPLAPNADERYLCLQFGAEEIDHYRRFSKVLAMLGVDTADMLDKSVAERAFFPAESMTADVESWEERAAFSFLCELEGHYQINEMVHSSFMPLAAEAKEILKEEARHFAHGKLLMRRAKEDPDTRDRAQQALDRFFPMAMDMFGRSDSARSATAVRWGLRHHTNGELRDLYRDDVTKQITRVGYRVPDNDASKRRFL